MSSVPGLFAPTATTLIDRPFSRGPLPPVARTDAALSILDVTEFFAHTSGGIRTYLLEKARYVHATQHLRHVLVVPGEDDRVTEIEGVRCYQVRGPRIPRQPPYRFMLATRSNTRIIQHERPDIVEVGSPMLVPWITRHAVRRYDIPLVGFYHTHVPRLAETARPGGIRRIAGAASWRYVEALSRMFARTIVASRFLADDLARAGIERAVHIPLGVDVDQFQPKRRNRSADGRRALGLPEGPLVIFVGRLAHEKELELLLDAWRTVERELDAHLLLVGDGPRGDRLRSAAASRRIIFRPFERDRARLADLLAAADVFVSPGRVETFGLAALEAMASGTPVITADQGGVAEQVADSGGGLAFPAGDAGALAAALLVLLTGDRTVFESRARQFAEREHAWPVVFDRLFALYAEVIAEGRR